ncbi:DUF533 domain-containing protein [Methylobacterium sp. Leaf117]|uniref:DUF533 domain-containing protein n=1 Tax=Methylobacterium sp. Leaf117 TaxID=1736260 RepID=UPI0006FDDD72|nr:DUF533 domain-containing protein [Methylobacterium sp. Leaf117]KQP91829.1 hypothetical protein ASF57_04840 [Methylobacterium sp. Leaf117]
MVDIKPLVDALVRSRRGSLAATAALGGLALVAGLAARALRGPGAPEAAAAPAADASAPTVGEDEARIMLRAMVAATLADGLIDKDERQRLDAAVQASGLATDGAAWLEAEIADPVDLDEIGDAVKTPEQAARIYAAVRLSVLADTLQEREFLKRLAETLDVPEEAVSRIEAELAA